MVTVSAWGVVPRYMLVISRAITPLTGILTYFNPSYLVFLAIYMGYISPFMTSRGPSWGKNIGICRLDLEEKS